MRRSVEIANKVLNVETIASRIQGALDSLSQNKVFPADIENAKRLLIDALNIAGIEAQPLSRAPKGWESVEGGAQ